MRKRNEFDESEYTFKSFIIKLFLIITIIIVLIWLIPKFFLYKKSKQHDEIKNNNNNSEIVLIEGSTINKAEEAGIKYFNKNNIPTKENEKKKVTLKELQKGKLIGDLKTGNTTCDVKNTYIEITKNDNDYTLKTIVKCSNAVEQKITSLNNYSYCNGSYLCERNEEKERQIRLEEESKNNVNMPSTGVDDLETRELTEFGAWKNYRKTSCDRKEIICDINNTNCLREVKVEKKIELVDQNNNIYEEVCYMSERTREYK